MSRGSDGGAGKGLAFLVVVVIGLLTMIPKPVWIALGVIAAIVGVVSLAVWAVNAHHERRIAAAERARVEQAAQALALKQDRIRTLGADNAALVEQAEAAVRQVAASEAARAGWLGDVDFTEDIHAVVDNLRRAHALRNVAAELSALDTPNSDDRRLLAEANTTAAHLEGAAFERVELIGRCAREAALIDESLRTERRNAETAEQRAELHAKLSAMLYGIEATPDTLQRSSAIDAVMSRVQAYREIKQQIYRARES
ncbi:hypothetical protein LV457_12645 [Mycobacterium sp. MYCO198283]|uniref:hypothetical protein n=1 Tax=Mycobacterium sp. MYCO198283 TaxID=2883505 RepID=UPI001E4B7140|nr:hypothetical protein [Mycobacterium sp. MYCO198283]MCG5433125.1 hypothetical protein [Mycobacterium sp. MYCO198283]